MSVMRELLDKILNEADEKTVGVQVYFKSSFFIPTPRGPVPSNVMAGAMKFGPVEGTYSMLTPGEGPNHEKILVESIFEADQVARVDREVGKREESRIHRPNGGAFPPA
jgi:hypothetical protein